MSAIRRSWWAPPPTTPMPGSWAGRTRSAAATPTTTTWSLSSSARPAARRALKPAAAHHTDGSRHQHHRRDHRRVGRNAGRRLCRADRDHLLAVDRRRGQLGRSRRLGRGIQFYPGRRPKGFRRTGHQLDTGHPGPHLPHPAGGLYRVGPERPRADLARGLKKPARKAASPKSWTCR